MTRARRDARVILLLVLCVAVLIIGNDFADPRAAAKVTGADVVAVILCLAAVVLYGRRAVDE